MKISNSVSFGAILTGQWSKVLKDAKTLAAYRNHEHKSDDYTKKLNNSLSIIDQYRPNEKFTVKVIPAQKYENLFKVLDLNNKTIFSDEGDELNFINNFANAINSGRIE